MAVRMVRLMSPRAADEGTRIGTVRRPPRGVPKAEFAARDWYDVWLPELAPSVETMKLGQQAVPQRNGRPSPGSTAPKWRCRRMRAPSKCSPSSRIRPTFPSAAIARTRCIAIVRFCGRCWPRRERRSTDPDFPAGGDASRGGLSVRARRAGGLATTRRGRGPSGKPGPPDHWTARRFAGNNLGFGNVSGTGKLWTGGRYWTN